MAWFSAHCVSYVKFQDGEQDCYPIEENVVLIEADSPESAIEKAQALAKGSYDGDEVEWDGRPAVYVFAGVRKVIECEEAAAVAQDGTQPASNEKSPPAWRPGHGTELTYAYLEVENEEDLQSYLAGESVVLTSDE